MNNLLSPSFPLLPLLLPDKALLQIHNLKTWYIYTYFLVSILTNPLPHVFQPSITTHQVASPEHTTRSYKCHPIESSQLLLSIYPCTHQNKKISQNPHRNYSLKSPKTSKALTRAFINPPPWTKKKDPQMKTTPSGKARQDTLTKKPSVLNTPTSSSLPKFLSQKQTRHNSHDGDDTSLPPTPSPNLRRLKLSDKNYDENLSPIFEG
mmetsp:Transcript_25122/g.36199  ORF Transcript_25122/g.36199 Transcript_25122/m.36199 type:complete len:207 (+) Transcript_25122:540-1160(+)